MYVFSISDYATTHTEDSVYIIGGRTDSSRTGGRPSSISTIAKYKDDIWTIAGNLNKARNGHGAITVNGRAMVIGGQPGNGET